MVKPTLTVYGATSFTARELLRYLDSHPDGDAFNVVLSGRNGQKLEKVSKGMKRQKELVQCDLTDGDAVRDLVAKSDAIVNLAGPFRNHNAEALIKECAATGTHYLDLCGERFFIGKVVIPRYDFQASRTGACIIPAAGFDSIPSDMTMYLALRTLQDAYPKATITSARSFFKVSGTMSGGTLATVKSETDTPPEETQSGEWVMTSRNGPTAPPRLIYQSTHPSLSRPLIGGFFFMYPFNRCIVRRSWYLSRLGESSSEPRHGDECCRYAYKMRMHRSRLLQTLIYDSHSFQACPYCSYRSLLFYRAWQASRYDVTYCSHFLVPSSAEFTGSLTLPLEIVAFCGPSPHLYLLPVVQSIGFLYSSSVHRYYWCMVEWRTRRIETATRADIRDLRYRR